METKIKILDKEFILKGKLVDEGVKFKFADEDDWTLHNKFLIRVIRIDENGDKLERRFYYYGSHADWEAGKTELTEKELLWAFRCFLEDALAGSYDFKEFCREFGYSEDSIKALRIYRECEKQLKKAYDLGIFESELVDMLNELSNMGIE